MRVLFLYWLVENLKSKLLVPSFIRSHVHNPRILLPGLWLLVFCYLDVMVNRRIVAHAIGELCWQNEHCSWDIYEQYSLNAEMD